MFHKQGASYVHNFHSSLSASTKRGDGLAGRVGTQFPQELVVHVLHRELPSLLHLLEEVLSVHRSTHNMQRHTLRRMRDVEAEGIGNHPEHIPSVTQVLDPLNLVKRVVRETWVEARHRGSLSHNNVTRCERNAL